MNTSKRAHAAWLDRCDLSGPPRLTVDSDKERAPLSFGWWAQTPCLRVSKYFHIEILYRLDRQPTANRQVKLVPSGFYGMSEAQARAYLLARQVALLPKLPPDYRWLGPQLIENIAGEPRTIAQPFLNALLPEHVRQRLEIAREIACAALSRRASTAPALGAPR